MILVEKKKNALQISVFVEEKQKRMPYLVYSNMALRNYLQNWREVKFNFLNFPSPKPFDSTPLKYNSCRVWTK